MPQENVTGNASAVMLADLRRNGVTDVVSEQPFSMYTQKLSTPKMRAEVPAPERTTAHTPQTEQATTEQSVAATPTAQKASKFDASEAVWQVGTAQDIAVVVASRNEKEAAPFSEQAAQLFTKMLAAIGLKSEDVYYIVMQEKSPSGRSLTAKQAKEVKHELEGYLRKQTPKAMLVVGQESCKTLLEENLNTARKQDYTVENCKAVALCHPQMLLQQSALKRMAWQDLLKFQSKVEG